MNRIDFSKHLGKIDEKDVYTTKIERGKIEHTGRLSWITFDSQIEKLLDAYSKSMKDKTKKIYYEKLWMYSGENIEKLFNHCIEFNQTFPSIALLLQMGRELKLLSKGREVIGCKIVKDKNGEILFHCRGFNTIVDLATKLEYSCLCENKKCKARADVLSLVDEKGKKIYQILLDNEKIYEDPNNAKRYMFFDEYLKIRGQGIDFKTK